MLPLISDIIKELENFAPPSYQENYDNAGLIIGNSNDQCTGSLLTLDVTEDVVSEAIENNCNLIIAHHPLIFSPLKKITGRNYVERCIIKCIKNNISVYAAHTNADNVIICKMFKMLYLMLVADILEIMIVAVFLLKAKEHLEVMKILIPLLEKEKN
jgi:dinuclear metal center YbgI/SA1388 family protein